MPSSWLSSGAGAAQGLEELLTRQRQDEIVRNNMAQHAATLAETTRSNKANEALHQQQFAGQESDRALQRESLQQQREAQQQNMEAGQTNQLRERVLQREDRRVPGTPMDYPAYQQVRSLGVLPMSSYKESPGDPLPEGDQGPPLPKIAFTGTQPQLMAQQKQADEVANRDRMRTDTETQQGIGNDRAERALAETVRGRQATEAATKAQRETTNEIAKGGLDLRRQQLADKEAERKAKDGEIKLGERAKKDLSSLNTASALVSQIMPNFPKDIEDPNGKPDLMGNRINPKYNTLSNRLVNQADVLKYKAGWYDESSPMIQLEKLLQPVQAGRYMAGSRNQKMLDLVLEHLGNPAHTQAEQYSRLKTLQQMTPALKQAIVNSERPVKVDASGKIMERSGGDSGGGLPAGVTVTRID